MPKRKPIPPTFPGEIQRETRSVVSEVDLTAEQEQWVRKYYPVTSNNELMAAMNISWSALYKIRDKYHLKKDDDYMKRGRKKKLEQARESQKENGRRGCHNYSSVHVRTRQKGPFVAVATKLSKEDYDTFSNLVTQQGLTKHEVIRSLITDYVKRTKVTARSNSFACQSKNGTQEPADRRAGPPRPGGRLAAPVRQQQPPAPHPRPGLNSENGFNKGLKGFEEL